MLSDDLASFDGKISCVTVGAPFVGNSALTRKVQRCGWEKYFHHFVYRADIVPRLLCAHSVPKEIVQQLQDHVSATVLSVQNAVQNFFRSRKNSRPPESQGIELSEKEEPSERGSSEPLSSSAEPTMSSILFGEKRAFDTFGHYYFLFRDQVIYLRTIAPAESFSLLRKAQGGSNQLTDHLLDSYNRAFAQLLR